MKKFLLITFTAAVAFICGISARAQESGEGSSQPYTQEFEGTLEINLAAMGGDVAKSENQSLILSFDSPTTCTITLCNFSFGEMLLGDIVVDNVEMSVDGTSVVFTGAKQGLLLAEGTIMADVACKGTLNMATQALEMNIDVDTMGMKIPVTFSGYPKAQESHDSINYVGSITIPTEGDPVVVENQTISITPTSENTCICSLYNFSFNGANLGDIVIEDVMMTNDQGTITYTGAKEGLSLALGMIVANVTCMGTENSDGELTMNIMVTLVGTDTIIPVSFNGKRAANFVYSITDDSLDAPKEYYRLDGVKVNANAMTPGIYIIRQGNKTHKAVIR